ncbi:MAG: FAD-dependent oxidoreductase [SAR324 cluster bacterium]|nr:FAD-dependent oxidoreductase [SAR324 cluster bacterium]
MAMRIDFNEELCTDCHLCEMNCSLAFTVNGIFEFRPSMARIRVTESADDRKYVAHVCLQCQDAACIKACPTAAISTNPETGVVEINDKGCIGCAECTRACEYDGVFMVEGRLQAPCTGDCQAGTDCREFLSILARGELNGLNREETLKQAFYSITKTNPLPAVSGRVCPHPCEFPCVRGLIDETVNIHTAERFIGEWAIENKLELKKQNSEKKPQKVAIIGSGPAGLSCAYQLAKKGFKVTIFESLEKPGGMLAWGIPPYRLPRWVLEAEIDRLVKFGITIRTGIQVGKDIKFDELKEAYDSVFIAIGSQQGKPLQIPGENASNVVSGLNFLKRVYQKEPIIIAGEVIVIGGGDTAIDAAAICRRLGKQVTILYRRTEEEMPAIKDDIARAREEGVQFEFLSAPVAFEVEENRVNSITCVKMNLEGKDSYGRPKPVPVSGSEYKRKADFVIVAVQQQPDYTGLEEFNQEQQQIKVDKHQRTGIQKTTAAGDVVGAGLVHIAIGQGNVAAETIAARLLGEEVSPIAKKKVISISEIELPEETKQPRTTAENRSFIKGVDDIYKETVANITEEQLFQEVRRCLICGGSSAVKCEVCDDPLCVKACAVKALRLVDDDQIEEQKRLYQEIRL